MYIAYNNQGNSPWSLSTIKDSVVHQFGIRDGKISYKVSGIFPGYLLNQFSLDEYEGYLRVATMIDDTTANGGWLNEVYILDPDWS